MSQQRGQASRSRDRVRKLVAEGIKPWLDEKEIRPGTSWQKAIGEQIDSIKSAAVFVGQNGLGLWQDEEIQALLSQFVKRECPVIPVVLPSAKATPKLPWTLANLNWVDFREADLDPLKQLIWGITGKRPCDQSYVSPASKAAAARQADDVQGLLPLKEKVTIEIRLPGKNMDEFSAEERDSILAGLYSLLKVGEVRVTRAMAGSVRLHLELKPEDADKIYAATQNGQLAALGISEARLYPAIAVPPDGEQRSQLLVLLDRVNETWVEGVLKNSLHDEVLISLGKRPMEEAVEPPWKHVVELSGQRSKLILQDRKITTIFDATGLLLILGEPGSGKTTTLLELASNLIARAKADAKERVPVVLNLSSWKKKQPLVEWISGELSEKYRVPKKIARFWLQNNYLLPLLDGLDEVETTSQPDCVAAINTFVEEFNPSGLVVCSRLNEYRWLPERLKLNGAVCLEPLSKDEVDEYLASGGSKLAALHKAVESDSVLQELTQTPLMLSIMSLACQGPGGDELASQKEDSSWLHPLWGSISQRVEVEERRKQIFRHYVEQMFQRKEMTSLAFQREKSIGRLSWLAGRMHVYSQSVFLVEGLQPSWFWLSTIKRAMYGTVVALILGLICGLIGGLSYGPRFGLIAGLSFFVGIELSCWSDSPLKNGIISGLIGGLAFALIYGLKVGLNVGLIAGLNVFISYTWLTEQQKDGKRVRVPDPRAFQLAEQLRDAGFDSRLDVYFRDNHYGFVPPEVLPGEARDPWIVWAEGQIRDADCVLLLCTPEYVESDPDVGACPGHWCEWHRLDDATRLNTRVPFLWYDWHFIKSALESGRAPREKFIPVGFGPYDRNCIPDFVRGATYCNLESTTGLDSLIRRIRSIYLRQNPRRGVFISYAHDDEKFWLDTLLRHLAPLKGLGIEVWTDRDIKPGALWHHDIQSSLGRAQVAVLMVTPAFLASPYIVSNELPKLLQAAKDEGLIVFWIPVKPSSYTLSKIKDFQAAHPPSQPLWGIEGMKLDEAFVAITAKLVDVLGIQ